MEKNRYVLLIYFSVFWVICGPIIPFAFLVMKPYKALAGNRMHRIFILHSYECGQVCGQPQHDGIMAALDRAGYREGVNLKIEIFFMDTKRHYNTAELIRERADIALERIDGFSPDVLVALDDNAFRTVALDMAGSDIPIVFCGVNGNLEDYNRQKPFMITRKAPGGNITGVFEKLHISDAAKVHQKLFPDLKKILFLTDSSPTGDAVYRQVEHELESEPIACDWEIRKIDDWEEYQYEIEKANRDEAVGALYPAVLLLKDDFGKTYTAPDIFEWTIAHSLKPEIAVNFAFTRMGLFGGAAVDFFDMGIQAGEMVAGILDGRKVGTISIEEAEHYALVFNLGRAKQLGIDIPQDIIMAADEVVIDKNEKN